MMYFGPTLTFLVLNLMCGECMPLSKATKDQYVFDHLPKIWFKYVKSFSVVLNQFGKTARTMKHMLMSHHENSLLVLRNARFSYRFYPVPSSFEEKPDDFLYVILYHKRRAVRAGAPLGNLLATGHMKIWQQIFIWNFTLSNGLSLNVSTEYLYFSSKIVMMCTNIVEHIPN